MIWESVEVADAMGSVLFTALEEVQSGNDCPGISVGDAGEYIVRIEYEDGEDEVLLHLASGKMYAIRPQRVMLTPAQRADLVDSFYRFKELEKNANTVRKVASLLGLEDQNIAHQTLYDDVWDDAQRADWGKWVSGGSATKEEWRVINDAITRSIPA